MRIFTIVVLINNNIIIDIICSMLLLLLLFVYTKPNANKQISLYLTTYSKLYNYLQCVSEFLAFLFTFFQSDLSILLGGNLI